MQKYHDEPKQYKGYLKSALVVGEIVLVRFSATAAGLMHGLVLTVMGSALLLPPLKRVEALGTVPSMGPGPAVGGSARTGLSPVRRGAKLRDGVEPGRRHRSRGVSHEC